MNGQDIPTRGRTIPRWVSRIGSESITKGGPESFTNSIGVILSSAIGLFGGGISVLRFRIIVTNSANFNKATLKRSILVRTEVIGGFTTEAKINGLKAAAARTRIIFIIIMIRTTIIRSSTIGVMVNWIQI